jgi:hypothetical protein
MKPELVQLHLDSRPTDDLPNRVWTYEEMGDRSAVLEWTRTGGGRRTTFPNGERSWAMSTRTIRSAYSTPSTTPLTPQED